MLRTFAFVAASILCITPAALLLGAAHAGPADASTTTAAPVSTHAGTKAGGQKRARRDVGCIGYHGSSSGYARNGKCVAGKKG